MWVFYQCDRYMHLFVCISFRNALHPFVIQFYILMYNTQEWNCLMLFRKYWFVPTLSTYLSIIPIWSLLMHDIIINRKAHLLEPTEWAYVHTWNIHQVFQQLTPCCKLHTSHSQVLQLSFNLAASTSLTPTCAGKL